VTVSNDGQLSRSGEVATRGLDALSSANKCLKCGESYPSYLL